MSALGMATLGVQCQNKALGMATLGVFCGEKQKEVPIPNTVYGGGIGKRAPSREGVYRDDMDIIALVVAAIESGVIR